MSYRRGFRGRGAFGRGLLLRIITRRIFSRIRTINLAQRRRDDDYLEDFLGFINNFNEDLWNEHHPKIIDSQVYKAGNNGQTVLLKDYFSPLALQFCEEGQSYEPEEFLEYVESELGDIYFNAINIIIEECSVELYELWEACWKPFSTFGTIGIFGTFEEALVDYQNQAKSNFFKNQKELARKGYSWDSYAASKQRSARTAKQFLRANPYGRERSLYIGTE